MSYINTTFAHGNGPYCRMVEWAIEVNNVREKRNLERLSIVVPLIYPDRQERILKEEIGNNVSFDFLEKYPNEILFDREQGKLLNYLMYKGKDYSENLELLIHNYTNTEKKIIDHLDGRRLLQNFNGENIELDLRDSEFQLGLNNRIQTGFPNQFYTAGGAGPFDEILERSIIDKDINLDRDVMKKTLPLAKRMIENQKIIFSNDPGVFSYDENRVKRDNEIYTPCFIHQPKLDDTELPRKGIYLMMSGIDGIRESGIYNAVFDLGMQIYTPKFLIDNLPDSMREKAIALNPSQINNPKIIAKYARAGWSEVWLSHMAEKGFITPSHLERDDPEIYFNHRGIEKFGLGTIIKDDPKSALKKAIILAENVGKFNQQLISKYKTLDGIKYAAEIVVDFLEGKNISRYRDIKFIS